MYTNKCTKCGKEFETKNPKRVICPECLYPERTVITQDSAPRSYSAGVGNDNYRKPFRPQKPKPRMGQGQRPNFKKQKVARPPLVDKAQLEQIEELYKKMLPLPNPDAHEVIAQKLEIEPKKAFFGINLIRQKMMLPKLNYPKRKLAVSPDQLMAIKNLYEPLLPTPPIGCHKILSAQLRMDEWRVHVGIGLIRKQMGLERWNPEREDAPEEFRKKK